MDKVISVVGTLLVGAGALMGLSMPTDAARYTSPNYTIDASIDNSFGGASSGGIYQLVSSGGESIVGQGAGGSYRLDQGYVAQLDNALELTVNPSVLNFSDSIVPGVSQSVEADVTIQTDAPGYLLAVNQTGNLSDGMSTISGISGSIASPVEWNEGSTKGLGVTLVSASPGLPGKWDSGNSYAALPLAATTIYSRSGFTGGSADTLELSYRLDVTKSQPTGSYSTTAVYTGTMLP